MEHLLQTNNIVLFFSTFFVNILIQYYILYEQPNSFYLICNVLQLKSIKLLLYIHCSLYIRMVRTAVVVLVWQRLVADCFNYCGHPCFRLTSLKRHSAVKTLNNNNNNNKLNQPQPTSASNITSVPLNNLIVYKMYFLFKQQL